MYSESRLSLLDKPFWGLEEASSALGLSREATRVYLCRAAAKGVVLRVRRNLYVLPSALKHFSEEQYFALANQAVTPSYISLGSALSHHGFTTQMPQDLVESISTLRGRERRVGSVTLRYFFLRKPVFFSFQKQGGVFIASPEKALLDALYLRRYGRYAFEDGDLDLERFSWERFDAMLKQYPRMFQRYVHRWRDLHEKP